MSGMERTKLMGLALQADYSSLKELGWLEVYEALKGWWPKRMSIEDLAPYLDALYGESAANVMSTLRGLRGEQWRPSPSSLYREMQGIAAQSQARKDSDRGRAGKRKRPDEQASALVRVRMLIDSGNPICVCTARSPMVREDRYHVLTCALCGGLEQGQVFAAQDDLDDVEF